ncbi:2-oxoglutarate translocator [Alkalithermobacter thermoalcaliphilus]
MRRCTKHLFGLIAIATGVALILTIILPNWLWMTLFAIGLIICGFICFK